MNFFNQGIPLGRWFGITVVIHWTFLIYAAMELWGSPHLEADALFLGLLFGTVLLHEFGHALSCLMVGGEAHHIVLWPLGGIAFVQPPPKPWAWLVTTACGPLVNAVLWPVFWAICTFILPNFGPPHTQAAAILRGACWDMYEINRLLLLFNLIPGYPMDGGRFLQEILWLILGYGRSLQIAGMVGTVTGLGFVVLGLGLETVTVPFIDLQLGTQGQQSWMLIIIGGLVVMESFGIYKRSMEIKNWRKN